MLSTSDKFVPIMEDNKTNNVNKPTRPTRATAGNEGSMLDRKIERRGLPASFSSNLNLPPRGKDNNNATANGGKLVKSMVNFFETSKNGEASKKIVTTAAAGEGQSSKSKHTSTKELSKPASSATNPPLPSLEGLAHMPDVENYSLTLLKYRQFYQQPLARCLDGLVNSENSPTPS